MDNEDMYEAEFINPNRNYEILLEEMKKRLKELQLDLLNINDPEVLGYRSNSSGRQSARCWCSTRRLGRRCF